MPHVGAFQCPDNRFRSKCPQLPPTVQQLQQMQMQKVQPLQMLSPSQFQPPPQSRGGVNAPPGVAPGAPAVPAAPPAAQPAKSLQRQIAYCDVVTDREGTPAFRCRYPGCEMTSAWRTAVRKHARLKHLQWLRSCGSEHSAAGQRLAASFAVYAAKVGLRHRSE